MQSFCGKNFSFKTSSGLKEGSGPFPPPPTLPLDPPLQVQVVKFRCVYISYSTNKCCCCCCWCCCCCCDIAGFLRLKVSTVSIAVLNTMKYTDFEGDQCFIYFEVNMSCMVYHKNLLRLFDSCKGHPGRFKPLWQSIVVRGAEIHTAL